MDWQRSIIIVLLAIVSYVMILKWNDDYGNQAGKESVQSSQQTYPQDTPDSPTAGDMPALSTKEQRRDVAGTSPSTLVSVETDQLSIMIDTKGGDIVQARFHRFPVSVDQPELPFTLLERKEKHTYVAQSGLIGKDGPDSSAEGRPLYRVAQTHFELSGDTLIVPMLWTMPSGVEIRKEFEFTRGSHLIKTRMVVSNKSDMAWDGAHYAQIKRDKTPDPSAESGSAFGLPTFLGIAYWTPEKPFNKYTLSDIEKQNLDIKQIAGGWLAMIQHYFLSAWIPASDSKYDYSTANQQQFFIARLVGQLTTIKPGESHSFDANLYVGPKTEDGLNSAAPGKGLHLALDYGPLFFISEALVKLMKLYHHLTGNWGVAIILLTLTVKLLFFYPSAKSYRSMAKMRKVQPEMLRLREQFSEDRQRLSQEMMKLYKDNQINPLGGCLPILIQMPVFLALYWGLLESVELRQAPFFGWIQDLSIKDPFFVLPLIMGGTMFLQQMLNPAPPDPTQAQMMKIMPIIFTVMFLWFPAGLVVYWITNNTLSILQQWVITRRIEAEGSGRH